MMKSACILLLTLCAAFGSAVMPETDAAPPSEPQALPEAEASFLPLKIPGTGHVLSVPTDMEHQLYTDTDDLKVILFFLPDYVIPLLYLFAIHAPDLAGTDIAALQGEEMTGLLSRISPHPEQLTPTAKHLDGGVPAVAAREARKSESSIAHHLLTLRGEWLYNLMLGYPDSMAGILPLDELLALQETLMSRHAEVGDGPDTAGETPRP